MSSVVARQAVGSRAAVGQLARVGATPALLDYGAQFRFTPTPRLPNAASGLATVSSRRSSTNAPDLSSDKLAAAASPGLSLASSKPGSKSSTMAGPARSSASCVATVEGNVIRVTSQARFQHDGGDSCPTACKRVEATCSAGPLAAGLYFVEHGGATRAVEVPGADPCERTPESPPWCALATLEPEHASCDPEAHTAALLADLDFTNPDASPPPPRDQECSPLVCKQCRTACDCKLVRIACSFTAANQGTPWNAWSNLHDPENSGTCQEAFPCPSFDDPTPETTVTCDAGFCRARDPNLPLVP